MLSCHVPSNIETMIWNALTQDEKNLVLRRDTLTRQILSWTRRMSSECFHGREESLMGEESRLGHEECLLGYDDVSKNKGTVGDTTDP